MNIRFLLPVISFLFLLANTYSQVPNGDFENWTNGEPDGWYTNNFPNLNLVTVTQSNDAHSGSSALQGEAIAYSGGVYYALIGAGKLGETGVPVSQNYLTVEGYYKLSSVGGDKLDVVVGMWSGGKAMGVGALEFSASASYTKFSVPIFYTISNLTADSCLINITIANDSAGLAHAGSVFLVDDISLTNNTTSVKDAADIKTFKLNQNYPNPFNPSTKISWQSPIVEWQSLKIYDILGNEVANLVNGYIPTGNYTVEFNPGNFQLSSGIYLYRLQVGNFIQTKKMTYLK